MTSANRADKIGPEWTRGVSRVETCREFVEFKVAAETETLLRRADRHRAADEPPARKRIVGSYRARQRNSGIVGKSRIAGVRG